MSKLTKADKDKLFNIATRLQLTTNWEQNRELLTELFSQNASDMELAAFWVQTSELTPLTGGAEGHFDEYFSNFKRGDLVQSEKLEALEGLDNSYSMSLKLGGQLLGLMLVQLKNDMPLALAERYVNTIIPQLGLARFATEMQEEVEKRTSTDKLTGLWKRSYFNERFREESERLSRSKEIGTVAILGLDDMAAMVRMMPQEEQNTLLEQVGRTLSNLLRQTDWVVRWDNFEVLFYFPNTSPEASVEVFARCVKALVRINPILQVVIGLCSSAETTSARGLIQLADKRLNLARKDGRHQLICFASKSTGLQFWEYKS